MNTKTNHLFISRVLLAALLVASLLLNVITVSAQTNSDLCVMTYNLRFANNNPGEVWSMRRPIMVELIKKISPDVFGTQEGLFIQIKNLATDLSDYEWIGLGREGGSKGEFMAIFYRKSRLEPLAYDHFWLSDTPEVMGSTTWGNKNRRMVTWIKFKDLASGQEFYFWNTHFDHEVQPAREKSATLVRQRIEELKTPLPVIFVGDFNAFAERNKAYDILTADNFLTDLWKTSPQRVGEGFNTFNGFKELQKQGKRIDWILARGPVSPESIEINTFTKDGHFPSDHCPVVAKIKFTSPK
jgi:endonuclease/exonuclease/phosphatase family metal-dependent hydrolase